MSDQSPQQAERVYFQNEPEADFHVSQWLEVVRRRRTLFIAVAAAVVAGSVVLYAITPRLYRATTVLDIERRASVAVAMQEAAPIDDWADAQSFLPTQYRLLRSRGIAEQVVKNLRLADDPVFNPGHASLTANRSGGAVTANADALGALASGVLAGVEVTPIRDTRLVEVSYTARSPELAARVANGIVDAFIHWGAEARFATVDRASGFLSSQIKSLKQEIQDKEAQLQAYSRRTDIVSLDPSSNVTLQRLEGLNKDYVTAVSERISKEARYQELINSPDNAVADTISGGLVGQLRGEQLKLEQEYAARLSTEKPDWPAMRELKSRIDKGRQHIAGVVRDMASNARDSAKAEYQGALRREQAFTEEMNRLKNDAMQLNSAAVEYNNLKVEVSARRALLSDLLRKQLETEVTAHLQGDHNSNVVVVDRALVPGGPYRPSLPRNLALGLVLGIGLGLGAVFSLEYLDRTIKTADDVDRILGLPVLAVIPDVSRASGGYGYSRSSYGYGRSTRASKATSGTPAGHHAAATAEQADVRIELLPQVMPRLAVSEAYRTLRTSLLLSTAGQLRSIVVTSALPGEGKTSTAVNLAVVLAQLGKQILLVDSDLRKPRLHEIFGIPNRIGLVNFLTGSAEAGGVVLPTQVPNLSMTPAGPIPPNASELLSSDRMLEFVALAYQKFEYVVLDTPPALPVTDAVVLGSMSDGIVLCVGAGMVLREDARSCMQRFQVSNSRLLGVALNFFRVEPGRYGKRYHSYESYVEHTTGDNDAKA
jgi:capsular exopolysaccharide synthesis family protein